MDDFEALHSQLQSMELARRRLAQLETERQEVSGELLQLRRRLEDEYRDVERLEQFRWQDLFVTVDNRDERLAKEKEEYLQVSLEYDALKKKLELLAFEKDVLEQKLTEAPALQKAWKQVLERRRKQLVRQGGDAARRLTEIRQSLLRHKGESREIWQAIAAGEQVLESISGLHTMLTRARKSERRDSDPPHPLAGMAGVAFLNFAQQAAPDLDLRLYRFARELEDVVPDYQATTGVSLLAFRRFLKSFAQSLAAAWLQPGRLRQLEQRIRELNAAIDQAMADLRHRQQKTDQAVAGLTAEEEKLVSNNE